MMRLFIYCAGGIGRESYDIAMNINKGQSTWADISFIDDEQTEDRVYGVPKYNYKQFKEYSSPNECRVIIAHGEPRIRKILADKVLRDGYFLGSVVDRTARISPSASLGAGIIVFPYAYISSQAVIGDNVLLSYCSGVGHDSIIGKSTVVSTLVSISGNCSIGTSSFIGTTACIKERVKIGDNTIIGMGSCVFRNIGAGMIAMGNPAREIKANTNQQVFGSKTK